MTGYEYVTTPPLPLDEMMSKLAMRGDLSAAKIKNHTKTEWWANIFYGLFKNEATPRGVVGGGLITGSVRTPPPAEK